MGNEAGEGVCRPTLNAHPDSVGISACLVKYLRVIVNSLVHAGRMVSRKCPIPSKPPVVSGWARSRKIRKSATLKTITGDQTSALFPLTPITLILTSSNVSRPNRVSPYASGFTILHGIVFRSVPIGSSDRTRHAAGRPKCSRMFAGYVSGTRFPSRRSLWPLN